MRTIFADLHTHTHRSDGVLPPAQLVNAAADRGVQVLSITDHDTIAGLEEGQRAATDAGITLVPGVELTVRMGDDVIHLLGYGFDPANAGLRDYLDGMEEERAARMKEMIDALNERGIGVTMDDVSRHAASSKALGRPSLAKALVEAGAAADVADAFETYIGDGQPAYVPAPGRSVEQGIGAIHDAGGFISIAHPGQWMSGRLMRDLQRAGADAIECVAPSHPSYLVDYYRTRARSSGLAITGGSDFHGGRDRDEERLGRLGLSEREWRILSDDMQVG
jgi:hypothetical protein